MNYSFVSNSLSNHPLKEFRLFTRLFVYTGFVFFIVSLPITSLFTSGENIDGFWILVMGWIGFIIFQFSWFANPLNLLALLLLKQRPITALFLSITAFALASQTLYFSEIPTGDRNGKIFIKELGLGFYFWYFSQGLIFIGIAIETFSGHKKTETSSVFYKLKSLKVKSLRTLR